jgi:hypothetical protein
MKLVRMLRLSFVVALLCAALSPRISADDWSKKTIVTISESVEVPGNILSAGTYVFKLADNPSYRHIVQIWTGDETHLIATIMAIPVYRDEVSDKPDFRFDERPGDSPQAIRAWFYPGEHYGNEFTYPHREYTSYSASTDSDR